MKRLILSLAAAMLVVSPAAALQAPAGPAVTPPASAAGKLTIDSQVKDLIANPKTDAVLRAVIPDVRANEQFATMGADMPLRDIAQYEPLLTEAKLKAVAEGLAKAQAN
jgi:hypothetical protein